MKKPQTALISVYDKSGVVDFASGLASRGIRLISTGGTAAELADAGLRVHTVEEITQTSEILGGRVKTLHPKIFAGILARRGDDSQMQEIAAAGIVPIDIVVVNLYPFQSTVADPAHTLEHALEQMDIGGVSLLRAAVKNFADVLVAPGPVFYEPLIAALDAGDIPLGDRLSWARAAVAHTAGYEAAICNYLGSLETTGLAPSEPPTRRTFPHTLALTFDLRQTLRYGENPHQAAAFYRATNLVPQGVGGCEQLHGKELSFNNILDLDGAWQLCNCLPSPAAAVIKHANPCGAAAAESLAEAYLKARSSDPVAAFGGIVGLNAEVDAATAEAIAETFIEAVVAPEFTEPALEVLRRKQNLRLVRIVDGNEPLTISPDYRGVVGGLLLQDRDPGGGSWECVTDRPPTPEESEGLRFVWQLISHVRSNAIVIGRRQHLIGVGAGQMSRVDACRLAAWKAAETGHDLNGATAASDAFFPFPDGVEVLAEAGVTAIVQPGGSIRDQEIVAAANRLGLAMIETGMRHFRH